MTKTRAITAVKMFAIVLLSAGCVFSQQTKNKGPQLREVGGSVVDKSENPLAEAVIYLENMNTKNVQSHISDDSGNYDFSGLDPNIDYQIYAEKNDLTSSTHTISSFDSRTTIHLELKVDRAKPKK